MKNFARLCCVATLLFSGTACASTIVVDLAADASRAAPNDLARATLFAEATGATPGDLAKKVNTLVADGLAVARGTPNMKVRSGTTGTYPVYAKGGRIEAWRMRTEIMLECGDIASLSEVVGRLQGTLGVSSLTLQPAPETRRKAETEATVDAIAAFRARARTVADALGKSWRIRQLSVGSQGYRPPVAMRAAAMEGAALPVEAGESQVTVSVSGQIEVSD